MAKQPRAMNRTVKHEPGAKKTKPRSSRPSKSLRAALAEKEPKDLVGVADEMQRDYQVSLAFRTIKALIKTAQVTITVDQEEGQHDPATLEKAEYLAGKCLELFLDRWSIMLDCIPYGRVAFEKVWKRDERRGCFILDDLDHLPYAQTEMLVTTSADGQEAGHFAGIRLSIGEHEPIDLEPEKSWWLALDPDATNPYGKSRFMGAPHEVYQRRKLQFEREEQFEDKLLFNGSVSHAPDDPIVEDGQSFDPKQAMDTALQDFRSGGNVILSNDRDKDGNYLWDVNLPEGMAAADPIISLIGMTDVHMLRAFGLLEKTIVEGAEVGSYALVSIQMIIVRAMCDEIFDQVKKSFQKYVLEPVSYFNRIPCLKINAPNLAQIPDSLLVEIVKSILTSPALSPLVISGAIDVVAMLKTAGIPISDNAKDVVEEMIARLKAAPVATAATSDPDSPETGTPTDPLSPEAPVVADIASTAMNGAQVSSLLEIIQLITGKLIPLAAGHATILAAFPGLTTDQVERIMAPLKTFETPPPGGTLANPQNPGEGDDLLAGLPTLNQLVEAANEEAARMWGELLEVMVRLHQTGGHESPQKAEALIRQLRELQADTMTAGRLIGMCSPWRPDLSSPPSGAAQKARTLSNGQPILMSLEGIDGTPMGGSVVRYPFLEDALAWLREKKLASASDVSQMAAIDKLSVFTAAGVDSIPTLQDLRSEVGRSLETGESFYNFRKRLGDKLTGTRAQQETLYRTNTKQAYNAGMEKTMEDPDVSDAFGFAMLVSTKDNRSRASHWAMDGFVCSRKDPAYAVMQRVVNDWGCRCGIINLNKRQAEQRGIKTYSDLPAETLAQYG